MGVRSKPASWRASEDDGLRQRIESGRPNELRGYLIAGSVPGAKMVVQNKYANRKPIIMSRNHLYFLKQPDAR